MCVGVCLVTKTIHIHDGSRSGHLEFWAGSFIEVLREVRDSCSFFTF